MRSVWRNGAVVVLWLGSGCGSPDDDTGPSSFGSGDGSSASTSAPTTASSMTSDASSNGTTTESSSGDTPTTAAADSTDEGPASTGPGDTGPTCEPPPPDGNACLECVVNSCCAVWVACQADEPCACVVDCHVVQGNSLGMCSNQCNLDSDLYQGLFFCGEANCLGTCDWSCC